MIPAKTSPLSLCTPPGMGSSLPPKRPSAFGLLTIASAQCTAEIFLWFRPLALSPSPSVKATCCLSLSPVISRIKNSRASHRFCCDLVSCPPSIVHFWVLPPLQAPAARSFPTGLLTPTQHPQIGPSYEDLNQCWRLDCKMLEPQSTRSGCRGLC